MEITHKNQGELDSTMLPFVMRELVELVMKKKALPFGKSSVSCPLKPSDSAPLKHSTMPP